jgi:hypothetical protein
MSAGMVKFALRNLFVLRALLGRREKPTGAAFMAARVAGSSGQLPHHPEHRQQARAAMGETIGITAIIGTTKTAKTNATMDDMAVVDDSVYNHELSASVG